jgi:hypothetical protein
VYIIRHVPPATPTSRDDLAAWAHIAVQYADRATAMPLVRLDRHGLTVSVVDDADPPAIGLPRRALIVYDSTPLCELRLVARSATSEAGRATTITLQPSRADDHAQLWRALRAHWAQWPAAAMPSRSNEGSERSLPPDPSAESRQSHQACLQDNVRADTDAGHREAELPASRPTDSRDAVSCDAAFSLTSDEDAWLFARWLDYHFAEVRARARMSGAAADLRDFSMRVVDHEVEVRFLFQSAEQVVRTSTELTCRWITAEAARQLGLTVEHWLYGTRTGHGCRPGWHVSAGVDSYSGSHSFSSSR